MNPQVESFIAYNLRKIIIWNNTKGEEIHIFCDEIRIHRRENLYFFVEAFDRGDKVANLELNSYRENDKEFIKKDGVMVIDGDEIKFKNNIICLYEKD